MLLLHFITDVHSNHRRMESYVRQANRSPPSLILDGGDLVHDGTEAELRRAFADRTRLESPWYAVRGNHDARLRGPFKEPAREFPDFESFEHGGIRFVLLDNHAQRLSDAQFAELEAELRDRRGDRIIVVMHVPPLLPRERLLVRLRHLIPFRLASPVMDDDEQVERFTELMERNLVLAVLAGHTHAFSDQTLGGVRYIIGGTVGGLVPGLRVAHEYLELVIDGREIDVTRVPLGEPAGDPVRFVARAFRFFADLNTFNHAELGWSYVPSGSVQWKSAMRWTEREINADRDVALAVAASFERQIGAVGRHALFSDLGLSAGERELTMHLSLGYKLRPVGDFNRNVFVAAAATANGGVLDRDATVGIGAGVGAGIEWRAFTFEVGRHSATNHRATQVGFGYRY